MVNFLQILSVVQRYDMLLSDDCWPSNCRLDQEIFICVFQVSQPYLGFCPDPKHFIVNCVQNIVKYAETWGENLVKNAILI